MRNPNYYELVFLEVKDKDAATATLILNPGHEIFKGHFPGQPVLPGVCMIEMVNDVLAEIRGRRCFLKESKQIKFLKMCIPDNTKPLNLDLHWEEEGGGFQVNALLSGPEDGVILKFQGKYT